MRFIYGNHYSLGVVESCCFLPNKIIYWFLQQDGFKSRTLWPRICVLNASIRIGSSKGECAPGGWNEQFPDSEVEKTVCLWYRTGRHSSQVYFTGSCCIILSVSKRRTDEGHVANGICIIPYRSLSLIKEVAGEASAWLGDFITPDLSKPRIVL